MPLPNRLVPPLLLTLLASLALNLPVPAAANLMAVDLGLSFLKVAVARPGRGLELVTNDQSKRKTPAAVAFSLDGERLFGDPALAYAAKAPNRTVLLARTLVGQCLADSNHPNPSPLCARARLPVEGVADFTGEELVAMLLGMARRQASAHLNGAPIKDVAVTVPATFDERQRFAIADAARIIGLNCLGVVNANTAAAIKYALDGKARPTDDNVEAARAADKKRRTPKTITHRVLFFDVGAEAASASVAEITSDVKSGVASSVRMLAHAAEPGVGGARLDDLVVERLADAFDAVRPAADARDQPARSLPRVMARLRKEGRRAREVLSANVETLVSIPSLHDDLDLRTTLTRDDFEADAAPILRRVAAPARAALADASLSVGDLDAVVPFGGASRTPSVQQQLCDALAIPSLNKSINTDEAAVMGAVFFAASLSSTFRVRKMDIDDVYSRGVSVEIEREEASSGGLFSGGSGTGRKKPQVVELFPDAGSKIPAKKTISLNRKTDFSMSIFLNLDKAGRARFPERTLYAKVNVKGVSDVLSKLKDQKKTKGVTPRVAISVHVDRSGLVRIGTAESSVDETVVVEREVEIKEDKKNKTDDASSKEKTAGGEGGKAEDEKADNDSANDNEKVDDDKKESAANDADKEGGKGGAKDKEEEKKEKKKTRIEKSTQTVVHRNALTIEFVEGEGVLGMQLSSTELEASQSSLKQLEAADKERVERADALNALEGYILEVRSAVRGAEEDDDLYNVSTEEEREKLVEAFDEAEDWMYTEDAKQTSNLRTKHFDLKKLYAGMEGRAKELAARPKAIGKLREAMVSAEAQVSELRKVHVEANSGHVEKFDKFGEFCEGVRKWVAEKEQEQGKRKLTEEVAVTAEEINGKAAEVSKEVSKLQKLEVPTVAPKVVGGEGRNESEGEEADGDKEGESRAEGEGSADETANSTNAEEGKSEEDVVMGGEEVGGGDASSAKADAGSGGKDEL